ncbi:MAG: polysulfide reductase NrfD [Candidatus Rokubacteria bacterium]|nr:polysulfide reductase NrfD [Candidatus Rokubacteria bacterium]
MGVGGGIFLLARLLRAERRLGLWFGLPAVDLVSFVVIGVGDLVLIGTLGRPLRTLRAVLRPGTNWISRGAIADFVFLVVGGALILPGLTLGGATPFAWLPWDRWASTTPGRALEVPALIAAAVVIFYAGQVLADGAAIPYWRSPAIPIQFVLSSLAVSMGTVMVMETLSGAPIGAGQFWLLLAFLGGLLVSIVWHTRTQTAVPGKAESLELLLRGRFRDAFVGGVVLAGTILPMIVALVGVSWTAARDVLGIVALLCTLPAGFALRLLTLRAGIYPSVRAVIRLPTPR